MSEWPDDIGLGLDLREGLRAIPTPTPGRDFDARVLAALQNPEPWWRGTWRGIRPVLSGAALSMFGTVILLHWASLAPMGSAPVAARQASRSAPQDAETLVAAAERQRAHIRSAFTAVHPRASGERSEVITPEPPERRSQLPRGKFV